MTETRVGLGARAVGRALPVLHFDKVCRVRVHCGICGTLKASKAKAPGTARGKMDP